MGHSRHVPHAECGHVVGGVQEDEKIPAPVGESDVLVLH